MQEIQQLLAITKQLRDNPKHQVRKFSLDGKLVGDIGEVLAAEKYGLELLSENAYKHDAKEIATGRMVQIKASFKNNSYFPFGEDKVPDYFLAINILENGELEELFNGPGKYIFEHYIIKRNLKHYKETYFTLSKGVLKELNMQVQEEDKIKIVKL
jgi:hypothetical protein